MLPVLFQPRVALRPRRHPSRYGFGRELDRVFDDLVAGAAPRAKGHNRTDVWEDERQVHMSMEVPGFARDEIDISVEDGVLSVTAEHKDETETKERHYHLRECHHGRLERRFRFPETVDPERVDARLENGVLTLALGKRDEVLPRKIEVQGDSAEPTKS